MTIKGFLKKKLQLRRKRRRLEIIRNYAMSENIERTLESLAQSEELREIGPFQSGVLLEKLLSNDEGIAALGKACEPLIERFPNSILLTYIRTVSLAKSDQITEANEFLSGAIVKSINTRKRLNDPSNLEKSHSIQLLKIWRVLDQIARNNMQWIENVHNEVDYSSMDFLQEFETSALDFDTSLFCAEPLLQGRHIEKYLIVCDKAYEQAETLKDKLRVINAIMRTGLRRLPSYHAAYDNAKSYFNASWSDIEWAGRGLKLGQLSFDSIMPILALSMTIAQKLVLAEKLSYLESILIEVAKYHSNKTPRWAALRALVTLDPIKHGKFTTELIDEGKTLPQTTGDIKEFLIWANCTEEYERAYKFFIKQPTKIKRTSLGLVFANILQRMGHFEQAKNYAKQPQRTMLSRPYSFCPLTSWNLTRRIGELTFAAETSELYKTIPQPTKPNGVIFIKPHALEQIRRTPIVVLMELKRMGWAIVPLVEGTLPYEKTGIEEIDRYAGCITLNQQIRTDLRESISKVDRFDLDAGQGKLKWRDIDLGHAVWEDSSVYKRRYNIDYSCPLLKEFITYGARWCELTAMIFQDMETNYKKLNLRTGFIVQSNHRLADSIIYNYCKLYGDPDDFFCLHSANGYQNYFANFSTNVSTKATIRNMTRHSDARSASFPPPDIFKSYYEEKKVLAPHILEQVKEVTQVKRSTAGKKELDVDAKVSLARINEWRSNGGKVACAFGKIPCDSSLLFDGGPAHTSLKDWLNHTIESVKDSNTLLLIKPHPHELNMQIATFLTEFFTDLIETNLNDNVLILGHRWFDIHALKEFVDLGLIYNGTTAVELGVMGIPSVLCCHFAPIDYPIGQAVPLDRDDYRSLVRFEKQANVAPDVKERAACWLHYMSGDEMTLDYRYNARQITNKVIAPSYWFEEDVQQYLYKGDKNVSKLAQRAIT